MEIQEKSGENLGKQPEISR